MKNMSLLLMVVAVAAISFPVVPATAGDKKEYGAGYYSGDFRDKAFPGKFYGVIEALPESGREGIWLIGGREIFVDRHTEIEQEHGPIQEGAYVEVEGNYSGETFLAYEIEVKGVRSDTRGKAVNIPSDIPAHKSNARSDTQGKKFNSVFSGVIEELPKEGFEGIWLVDGREVSVDNNTLIEEARRKISVGSFVKIKGVRTGKTIVASEIEVEAMERGESK